MLTDAPLTDWETTTLRLVMVGDIGGTHARFGLVDVSDTIVEIEAPQTLLCSDFTSLEKAVDHYLQDRGLKSHPLCAAIAVAGPVTDGATVFTNMAWTVSETDLRAAGFPDALLLNDYEALASAAPLITEVHAHMVGPLREQDPSKTVAVLGAGTGFGVSALVRNDGCEAVMATEGGHIAFAPCDTLEIEILRNLTARFGRVSIERILSGPGLFILYCAMCEIAGRPKACSSPAEVSAQAMAGDLSACEAVERFCGILGATAGDFALAYGAQGGVYIAGGVAPRLLSLLEAGSFRERFEAKGRFGGYMSSIPTGVITHPYLALLGAARRVQLHDFRD